MLVTAHTYMNTYMNTYTGGIWINQDVAHTYVYTCIHTYKYNVRALHIHTYMHGRISIHIHTYISMMGLPSIGTLGRGSCLETAREAGRCADGLAAVSYLC